MSTIDGEEGVDASAVGHCQVVEEKRLGDCSDGGGVTCRRLRVFPRAGDVERRVSVGGAARSQRHDAR